MIKFTSLSVLFFVFISGCSDNDHPLNPISSENQEEAHFSHLVNEIEIRNNEKDLQVIIEITAGSNEKWEVNKVTGELERDSINGEPRTIHYLGYPANYGFIPQTILPKELGGDGDPLDAIVLGNAIPRGEIATCTILGMLKLKDRGEQDDKLILAETGSQFAHYQSLAELQENHPGMLEALEDWFVRYKGPGKMVSEGFADARQASKMIQLAHENFLKIQK